MLGVQSIEKNEWRLWLTIKIYVTGKRAGLSRPSSYLSFRAEILVIFHLARSFFSVPEDQLI